MGKIVVVRGKSREKAFEGRRTGGIREKMEKKVLERRRRGGI